MDPWQRRDLIQGAVVNTQSVVGILAGELRMSEPTEVTDPVIEAGDENPSFARLAPEYVAGEDPPFTQPPP
jgi:hypothetical protein